MVRSCREAMLHVCYGSELGCIQERKGLFSPKDCMLTQQNEETLSRANPTG